MIPEGAINSFLLWSTHPYCDRKTIDETMVQMLLLSCVPQDQLVLGEVKEPVIIFIEGSNEILTLHECIFTYEIFQTFSLCFCRRFDTYSCQGASETYARSGKLHRCISTEAI